VQLVADSLLCGNHFKPEDIICLKSRNGKKEKKFILTSATPIKI